MAKIKAASAPAITADLRSLMQERDAILRWLKPAQDRELEIRKHLAASFFPSPTEGINRTVTADGYEVILNHKINRKVDEAAIDAVMMELPEDAPERVPGVLIAYKPTLVLSGYRGLSADKLRIVAQAVTETDGSPELTIVPIPSDGVPEPTNSLAREIARSEREGNVRVLADLMPATVAGMKQGADPEGWTDRPPASKPIPKGKVKVFMANGKPAKKPATKKKK